MSAISHLRAREVLARLEALDDGSRRPPSRAEGWQGADAGVYLATLPTVSQVRVVTSLPNVLSMSAMNTGPRGLGT